MPFDVIRREKGIEILQVLLRGGKGIRELQEAVEGSYSTICRRIQELEQENLVQGEYYTEVGRSEPPYAKRLIKLTEKGRNMVESLIESRWIGPLLLRKAREKWTIALLHSLKRISGTTRLMKLLFLLKHESGFTKCELSGFYRFRPWKFGPFSKQAVKDLEELNDDGFIGIEARPFAQYELKEGQSVLYLYELTEAGEAVVGESLQNLPQNVLRRLDCLKKFNEMPLIDLLRYVYARYPEFVKESAIVAKVIGSNKYSH